MKYKQFLKNWMALYGILSVCAIVFTFLPFDDFHSIEGFRKELIYMFFFTLLSSVWSINSKQNVVSIKSKKYSKT